MRVCAHPTDTRRLGCRRAEQAPTSPTTPEPTTTTGEGVTLKPASRSDGGRWLRARGARLRPRPPKHDSRGADCTKCPRSPPRPQGLRAHHHEFVSAQMKRIEVDPAHLNRHDTNSHGSKTVLRLTIGEKMGWCLQTGSIPVRLCGTVDLYLDLFQQRSGIENLILLKMVENMVEKRFKKSESYGCWFVKS